MTKRMHRSPEKLMGLILAGGLARRMGSGTDKAFLPLAGRPLLAHVLERFSPQVDQVILSANGDPKRFEPFGIDVLADVRTGFQGPMAGVETAFAKTKADWILSVAVDLPFLPHNLAEKMLAAQKQADPGELMVATSENRCHHVVCLWPRVAMEKLQPALEKGQLCLRDWFRNYPHRSVAFTSMDHGPDPFFNVNRPEDLQVAEKIVIHENRQPVLSV